ncbi:TFIIA-alpha and beta-like factor, 1-like factor [Wickerhamomyces ciferrii]|uniref:Transcription initiation factor IIA large subunit n=1 Tax=Wickerhamomyces ciferrii (strain ATCC 14091 / BCRC 22168 / CBS 111 / JCM 3599 / NBRC 0793 / NRRL Y-1031 F-60-10) TaxID=1206466 RepID=K0KDX5_WICCF|nr:TFIIA-alpha and beta-like factor, 1-like factor [Wickerhamomyces ciferrii]CCH41131.1 TFIIA-alpha and beta-like factor, 1-like factor [Wickerhamomyces ciferrii]
MIKTKVVPLQKAFIYEQIIDDVINESRQDFEDSGIDEATLQDLRNIWRENLSQTKVAQFSWAPDSAPTELLGTDQAIDTTNPNQTDNGVKKEDSSASIPQESTANFELEISGNNATVSQKSKESSEKKERTLASLDSDDINSDLDDSDEEDLEDDEDADDAEGMIILCLYEKVLRVKNKWKCNLKDGVANINGRDYAFAKGTGESEW